MQAPGHIFLELYVKDLPHYLAIFREVLGFEVVDEEDDDFVKLRASHATVMLNATARLPPAHPFADYRSRTSKGMGVEMGFVTEDLERARRAAQALPGCVVSEVTHQEWGMSDFRIETLEGYYFRVTTPDPEQWQPRDSTYSQLPPEPRR